MATKITFHSKKSNRTTTLRTERNPIESDKVYTLVGPSSELLTNETVYEQISKVETPFLLGIPRIIAPGKDQVVTDDTFINFEISEAIFSREFIGQLTHIEWQIAEDEEFKNLIYKQTFEFDNANKDKSRKLAKKDVNLNVLIGEGFVRARYLSNKIASPYTQPLRFKVANRVILKPKIEIQGLGVNVTFKVSNFTVNTEAGRDVHKFTLYKLFKIPKDEVDFISSFYNIDEKYNILEVRKSVDDPNVNNLPFPEVYNNEKVSLKAGEHIYVLQARHRGELYTSEIGYGVVDATGLKVKTPDLEIRNNELTPTLYISPFAVGTGTDKLKEYELNLFVIEEGVERLVHGKMLTENEYIFPDGVIQPSKRYRVSVIAHGESYVSSDPGILYFTMPFVGINKPFVNLQNLGMEPKFTLSPFKTTNCLDNCVGAEWELYTHDDIIDENLEPVTSLVRTYSTGPHLDNLQIIKSDLEPNTNYIMKVRYVGEKYKSAWAAVNFKSANLEIQKPVVTVIVDGLTFTLDITEYKLKGATDIGREVQYFIYKKNASNIETDEWVLVGETIKTKYIKKKITVGKKEGIVKDTKYKIVGKIIGEYFSSPMSDPVYVTTDNIYIKSPIITLTGYPDNVPERPVITTSKFEVSADEDKHVSTSYIINKKTADGLELVYQSLKDTKNLTSLVMPKDVLKPKTYYTLTVMHHGELYESSEPVTIEFRTRNHFLFVPEDGDDGMQVVIVGDDKKDESPKYYGTIPFEKLNNDRNYLGNWDGSKVYSIGEQVLYEGKLYYSTKNKNENRRPDLITQEGIRYWEEDHRRELPTYKWVMKHIGFPVSEIDFGDNLSSGIANVGIYRPNTNSNVVKVAIDGRVLYVYDKCELMNICYNDLVKMGIHGTRNRTIRVSDRLYYIRTLTSRELHYFNILKILDNENLIDIDIRTSSYVADTDQNDPSFRLVNNEFYKTNQVNALERTQSFRLVLEYIPEEEEPWIYVKDQHPTLNYDRYTDTGFIGHIDYREGFNIYDELGIYKGTRINRDAGYLDFYYHGKRIIINRMPIVYGVSFKDVLEWGAVYDKDMIVPNGYVPTVIENFPAKERAISVYPRLMKGGAFALGEQGIVEDNLIKATQNVCRYSEWNELLYRVAEMEPKWVDNNYSHGGFQIGSNWATYDRIGVGVNEYYSGNGCYCYVLSSVNGTDILSRGGQRLENVHWVARDLARNDYGVRLAFEDTTVYIPFNKIPENKPEPPLSWTPIDPDTVIKTDPIDLFTPVDGTFNNESKDFKLLLVKDQHIDKFTDELVGYSEADNNILTAKIFDNVTFAKFNNYYYTISKVETFNIKTDVREDNLFIKNKSDEGNIFYNYPIRPSVKYNGNQVMFYFGTESDAVILTLDKEFKDQDALENYLITAIDGSGNGDKINNYTYTVMNLKTPRAAVYEGLKYQMAPDVVNELTYLECTTETFDVNKCLTFTKENTVGIKEEYQIVNVGTSLIEHINDLNMKFIIDSRNDVPRVDTLLASGDELWMLNYNNKLYQIVPIISRNSIGGLYTLEGFMDPERVQSPYIDRSNNKYNFPTADTVVKIGNRFFIYQGYRVQYVNGLATDNYLDFEIIGNGISNTDEIKDQFLKDNGLDKMRILKIHTSKANEELIEGTYYQIGNIDNTVYEPSVAPAIPDAPEVTPDAGTENVDGPKVDEDGSVIPEVIMPDGTVVQPETTKPDTTEPEKAEEVTDAEVIEPNPVEPDPKVEEPSTDNTAPKEDNESGSDKVDTVVDENGTVDETEPKVDESGNVDEAESKPEETVPTEEDKVVDVPEGEKETDAEKTTEPEVVKPEVIEPEVNTPSLTMDYSAPRALTQEEVGDVKLFPLAAAIRWTADNKMPGTDMVAFRPQYIKVSDANITTSNYETLFNSILGRAVTDNQLAAYLIPKKDIQALQPDYESDRELFVNSLVKTSLGVVDRGHGLIDDAKLKAIPYGFPAGPQTIQALPGVMFYEGLEAYKADPVAGITHILTLAKLMYTTAIQNLVNLVNETFGADTLVFNADGKLEKSTTQFESLNRFENELTTTFVTDDVDLYNIAYLSYFYSYLFYPERGYMVKPM